MAMQRRAINMGTSINMNHLFETAKSSFEPGTLPEDMELPDGFTVWKYPISFTDDDMVLTDGTRFFAGSLQKVWRKGGILPFDDPCFSALIQNQLDKKAKRDRWVRRLKGGRLATPEPVHDFRRQGSNMDEKTLVWPGDAFRWSDKPSGVTWIGLHGTDSICVVTKAGEPEDLTRMHPYFKDDKVENALCNFRKTITSEIEDVACAYSTFINVFGQSIPEIFGVVSLALGSIDAQEESGRMEYLSKVPGSDKKKYLREQMRMDKIRTNDETAKASGTNYGTAAATSYLQMKMEMMHVGDFTVVETIKTAIAAFQYLLKKEFESHEIGVSIMSVDPSDYADEEFGIEFLEAKHLEMKDIEKCLAAIKEPGWLP